MFLITVFSLLTFGDQLERIFHSSLVNGATTWQENEDEKEVDLQGHLVSSLP